MVLLVVLARTLRFLLVMQEPKFGKTVKQQYEGHKKKQPLPGERVLGGASLNPHTHQLDFLVQVKALTTEMEILICFISQSKMKVRI